MDPVTAQLRGDSPRVTSAVFHLRAAGERVTRARRAVLRVIDAADRAEEHLTAEQIGTRVTDLEPSVHRATVYRTLTSLTGSGVISHVHLGASTTVYHLSELPTGHAHVQCVECGAVLDVSPRLLGSAAEGLLRDHGFTLDTTHVALLGRCRRCTLAVETGRP